MKSLVFAASFIFSAQCFACNFASVDTPEVRRVVKVNGGYPISNQQCKLLADRGLALRAEGESVVLEGVSVGWAIVHLQGKDSHVASFAASSSTAIDTKKASQPAADEMLFKALKVAIADLDFEQATKEIEASSSTPAGKR